MKTILAAPVANTCPEAAKIEICCKKLQQMLTAKQVGNHLHNRLTLKVTQFIVKL
jgi:hypothetical protein